jgi:hypothetical protein
LILLALILDNCGRWVKPEETENIGWMKYSLINDIHGGETDFPPKVPKMIKLTFAATGDPGGTVFTLILDHGNRDRDKRFQAVIKDIPLSK